MAQPFRTDLATRRVHDRLREDLAAEVARIAAVRAVRPLAIAAVEEGMALGSGRMAASIVSGIQEAVARAMTDARSQIGSATDELVAEIKSGAVNVKRAIQAETSRVREEFGQVVGNATAAAEEALDEAKNQAGAQ